MRRQRSAKIVATLGPASSTEEMIDALFRAGVDVFRLNFSHGKHEEHRARLDIDPRAREAPRPAHRHHGRHAGSEAARRRLRRGQGQARRRASRSGSISPRRRATRSARRCRIPRSSPRSSPAPTCCSTTAISASRSRRCGKDFADTLVDHRRRSLPPQGRQVPNAVLPMSALTPKDRADLAFALSSASTGSRSPSCSGRTTSPRREAHRRPRRRAGEAREAGGDPPAGRDHRAGRRASWSRAAISASRCRPRTCRRCSARSSTPAASPASRSWSRRRCWNRWCARRCRPAPRPPTSRPRSMRAPTR